MDAAFDACSVISAMKVAGVAMAQDSVEWRCRDAIQKATPPRVSAPAWFEICRYAKPEEQDALKAIASVVRIDAIDRATIEVATALQHAVMREAKTKPKDVCQACGNPFGDKVSCTGCGRATTTKGKFGDFLMVAAAARDATIKTLYSIDTGVLNLAGHVRSDLRIIRPPSLGGALVDAAEERERRAKGVAR